MSDSIYASAADGGAGIADAYSRLGSNGGTIEMGRGDFSIGTTLNFNTANKPVSFIGHGAAVTGIGTRLIWAGGASPVISVGANAKGLTFANFMIGNTGTATVGLQVDGGADHQFDHVYIVPAVPFSSYGAWIGPTASVVAMSWDHSEIRGQPVCMQLDHVGAHFSSLASRWVLPSTGGHGLVLGSAAGATPEDLNFLTPTFDGSASPINQGSNVYVNRVRGAKFVGAYHEIRPGFWAIEVPSTAAICDGLVSEGGFWSGGDNTPTEMVKIDNANAYATFRDGYVLAMAGGGASKFLADGARGIVRVRDMQYKVSGMVTATDWTDVESSGNVLSSGAIEATHTTVTGDALPTFLPSVRATWDPASLAPGDQTIIDVTYANTHFYDKVLVGSNASLQGITATAYIKTAGTASLVLRNGTAGTIDIGSGSVELLAIVGGTP